MMVMRWMVLVALPALQHTVCAAPQRPAKGALLSRERHDEKLSGSGGSSKLEGRRGLRSGSPEQLEPWHDSGLAVKSGLQPAQLQKLGAGITAEAFRAQLSAVVDADPTRFIAYKGNTVAAVNIEQEMKKLGLRTEVQPVQITTSLERFVPKSHALSGNVLGFLPGTDLAGEVVIVACHYDSVNWNDISKAAPGADDNGSGVALMLLLAKALTASDAPKPRRSVLFAAFNAEEEGLVGSKEFAKLFKTSSGVVSSRFGKPVAALVADEVAWPGVSGQKREVIFETRGRGNPTNVVVDTLAHSASQLHQCSSTDGSDCMKGFVVNYHGFGSDHIPLLDADVPAVLLIERDNMYHADKWGHSAEDTLQHVDCGFGASTTQVALQAVATLASPASV